MYAPDKYKLTLNILPKATFIVRARGPEDILKELQGTWYIPERTERNIRQRFGWYMERIRV